MDKKTGFILQGGGALGAYQAGACHSLFEKNIHPDWLVGISIGALNTAIIAGNKPENRIQALNNFWTTISSENGIVEQVQNINPFMTESIRKMLSGLDTQKTIIDGQKGFFSPKRLAFNLLGKFSPKGFDDLSYYDTSELKETLLKYVDFDLINKGNVRVCLGVVKVESGEFIYFDNHKEILTAEHFMASGALPPGFPAIKINNEYYWDGGISNNSAIDILKTEQLKDNWTIYQIDLWRNEHELPNSFDELTQRLRDIQFASHNKEIDLFLEEKRKEKNHLKFILSSVSEDVKETEIFKEMLLKANLGDIEIKRIIYQGMEHETRERPYQFGLTSIKEHWENGYIDINNLLKTKPSLKK